MYENLINAIDAMIIDSILRAQITIQPKRL